MPVPMYEICVPVCVRVLGGLAGVLDKAAAHCEAGKIEPTALLTARLYPDMHPLTKQVQMTCDFARWGFLRLAGLPVERTPDTETSFAELQARVESTIALLRSAKPEQLAGSEDRTVAFKAGQRELSFTGQTFLLHFALPHMYFHAATAYDILRHNGVEIGKRDFMGAVPGQ